MYCPTCLKVDLKYQIIPIDSNCYVCENEFCDLCLDDIEMKILTQDGDNKRIDNSSSDKQILNDNSQFIIDSICIDEVSDNITENSNNISENLLYAIETGDTDTNLNRDDDILHESNSIYEKEVSSSNTLLEEHSINFVYENLKNSESTLKPKKSQKNLSLDTRTPIYEKLMYCPTCLKVNLKYQIIRISSNCYVCENDFCVLCLDDIEMKILMQDGDNKRIDNSSSDKQILNDNSQFITDSIFIDEVSDNITENSKTVSENLLNAIEIGLCDANLNRNGDILYESNSLHEKEVSSNNILLEDHSINFVYGNEKNPVSSLQPKKSQKNLSLVTKTPIYKKPLKKNYQLSINYLAKPITLKNEWKILSMLLLHLDIFDNGEVTRELEEARLQHAICTNLANEIHSNVTYEICNSMILKLTAFIKSKFEERSYIDVPLNKRFLLALDQCIEHNYMESGQKSKCQIITKMNCKKCSYSETLTEMSYKIPIPFKKTYFSISYNHIHYQIRCKNCPGNVRVDVTIEGNSGFFVLECNDGLKDRIDRYNKPLTTMSPSLSCSHTSKKLSLVAVIESVVNIHDKDDHSKNNHIITNNLSETDILSSKSSIQNIGGTHSVKELGHFVPSSLTCLESSDKYKLHIKDKNGWITMSENTEIVCDRVKMLKVEKSSNVKLLIYGHEKMANKINVEASIQDFISNFKQSSGEDLRSKAVDEGTETTRKVNQLCNKDLIVNLEYLDVQKLSNQENYHCSEDISQNKSPSFKSDEFIDNDNKSVSSLSDLFSVTSDTSGISDDRLPPIRKKKKTVPSFHSQSTLSEFSEDTDPDNTFSHLPWVPRFGETFYSCPSVSSSDVVKRYAKNKSMQPVSSSGVSSTCSSVFSKSFRGTSSSLCSVTTTSFNSESSTLLESIQNCVKKTKRSQFSIDTLITQKKLKLSKNV